MVPATARRVGRTSVEVTTFGMGGTTLGGRHVYADVDAAGSLEMVDCAFERGVTYFDTAPFYGTGNSEMRLGQALAGRPRRSFTLSTKVGRRLEPLPPGRTNHEGAPYRRVFDYSAEGARRSLSESLERMRLDRVDLVYIHDVGNADHFHEAMDGAYRVLTDMRNAGVIGAIGVGVGSWETCRDFIHAGEFDIMMLGQRYTLFEHVPALYELLPLCLEKGVSVAVAGPFSSGIAATGGVEGARYNYGPAGDWAKRRADQMAAIGRRHGVSLAAAALQFPLGHPAVITVVAGSRSTAELRTNLDAMSVRIPDGFWDELVDQGLICADVPLPRAFGDQSELNEFEMVSGADAI